MGPLLVTHFVVYLCVYKVYMVEQEATTIHYHCLTRAAPASPMAQQQPFRQQPEVLSLLFCVFIVGTRTHIDDRILELDVEPVVRNGNDGFVSVAKIFNPFPLKNWERHLQMQHSRIIVDDQCQTIET